MSFLKLDDYTVPGYNLKVGLTLPLKDEDASGESSSTAKAKKGAKGKKLSVKVMIKFTDEELLHELMRMTEATAKGDSKVYTITNQTANVAGMRQGRFSGDVKADVQENIRAWLVSFSLAEQESVPEMAEQRETSKGVNTTSGPFINPYSGTIKAGKEVATAVGKVGAMAGSQIEGILKIGGVSQETMDSARASAAGMWEWTKGSFKNQKPAGTETSIVAETKK